MPEQLTILIPGGAGFIGTNLTMRLAKTHRVIVIDNFSTGNSANLADTDCEVIDCDIRDFEGLNAIFSEEKPDLVINLACPASPVHYQADPIATFEASVVGVMNLCRLCYDYSARLIHASTSEVYGDPQVHPQTEEYWGNVNPVGDRSCYDEGKRAAETYIRDWSRLYGLDATVLRLFNTYGPYMAVNDGRVVSNFICQALAGEPLTIYGEGTQTRSFQYIDDLLTVFEALIAKRSFGFGPFNVGTPYEFSMNELATMICYLIQSESTVQYCPLPSDDPKVRRADIAKLRTKFDYNPRFPLDEGLERTIEYFRTKLKTLNNVK